MDANIGDEEKRELAATDLAGYEKLDATIKQTFLDRAEVLTEAHRRIHHAVRKYGHVSPIGDIGRLNSELQTAGFQKLNEILEAVVMRENSCTCTWNRRNWSSKVEAGLRAANGFSHSRRLA